MNEQRTVLDMKRLMDAVQDAACQVRADLGAGCAKGEYEARFERELEQRELAYQHQVWVPESYKGMVLNSGYSLDYVVEESIVVELLVADEITPMHEERLLNYLRLSGCRMGLLVNYNERAFRRRGIRKLVYSVAPLAQV